MQMYASIVAQRQRSWLGRILAVGQGYWTAYAIMYGGKAAHWPELQLDQTAVQRGQAPAHHHTFSRVGIAGN